MIAPHAIAGVGATGRRVARALAARQNGPAALRVTDLDLPPGDMVPPPPKDVAVHLERLTSPTGRGTGKAWYFGRLAYETRGSSPPVGGERITTVLSAAGGTGAGAGPGTLRDLARFSPPDALRAAAVVLPASRATGSEDVNAAFALGGLIEAGAGVIVLADPQHVADVLASDPDPFLVGPREPAAALSLALTESLAGLDDLARGGWTRRDLAAALKAGGDGPAFVVPGFARVAEEDLRRVNLTGWFLSLLDGSTLAEARPAEADAILLSARIPAAWAGHAGLRAKEEIESVVSFALDGARVDVELAYTAASEASATLRAYLVSRSHPRVARLARAGIAEASSPSFEPSVRTALEVVGGVERDVALRLVAEYRANAERLLSTVEKA